MNAVGDILDAKLFGNTTAFDFLSMESVESGRKFLVARRVGQQITCKLPGYKVVVGKVLPEGANDPVTPLPDSAVAIDLVAVGVGVARYVQPLGCKTLGGGIGIEKTVDDFFKGVGRSVGEKGINFGDGWRKAGEIEGDAAQPLFATCVRGRGEVLFLKSSGNELIDGSYGCLLYTSPSPRD